MDFKLCLVFVVVISVSVARHVSRGGGNNNVCDQLPPVVLSGILGPAFNSRYMSIDVPRPQAAPGVLGTYGKRGADADDLDFYVDNEYALDLSDVPAWEMQFVDQSTSRLQQSKRGKRAAGNRNGRAYNGKPWQCESKIRWIDLGADYFPQFLRTVECVQSKCWYSLYTCQPRSFTVKILRRRNGRCVKSGNLKKVGNEGLHDELKEMWVWEERAINFCCDCSQAW